MNLTPQKLLRYQMTTARALLLAVALTLPHSVLALDAPAATALANSVLTQLGRTKGVCAVPNCGNGNLALAFLQNSAMKVHAMDADAGNAAAARTLAHTGGFYAPRAYAERHALSSMPYAVSWIAS
jgi:hypothetical protein